MWNLGKHNTYYFAINFAFVLILKYGNLAGFPCGCSRSCQMGHEMGRCWRTLCGERWWYHFEPDEFPASVWTQLSPLATLNSACTSPERGWVKLEECIRGEVGSVIQLSVKNVFAFLLYWSVERETSEGDKEGRKEGRERQSTLCCVICNVFVRLMFYQW